MVSKIISCILAFFLTVQGTGIASVVNRSGKDEVSSGCTEIMVASENDEISVESEEDSSPEEAGIKAENDSEEPTEQEVSVDTEASSDEEESTEQNVLLEAESSEPEIPSDNLEISKDTDNPDIPADSDNQDNPDASDKLSYAYRLIVCASSEAVIREADQIISDYEGIYILGFDTTEDLEEALSYYNSAADFAEIDKELFTVADDESAEASEEEAGDDSAFIQEDDAIELLKELVDEGAYKNADIALIDTGVSSDRDCSFVSLTGEDPYDGNGHGTRMYDIIREESPSAKILSIKAFDDSGRAAVTDIYAAIMYAIDQKVDIINISATSLCKADSTLVRDAVLQAIASGITVVGAAGNYGLDVRWFIPANIDEAIIVGACDTSGNILDNSNYGGTVDYYINASSTSEAAARASGILFRERCIMPDGVRIFAPQGDTPEDEGYSDVPLLEDAFLIQATPHTTVKLHHGGVGNRVYRSDDFENPFFCIDPAGIGPNESLSYGLNVYNWNHKSTGKVIVDAAEYNISMQDILYYHWKHQDLFGFYGSRYNEAHYDISYFYAVCCGLYEEMGITYGEGWTIYGRSPERDRRLYEEAVAGHNEMEADNGFCNVYFGQSMRSNYQNMISYEAGNSPREYEFFMTIEKSSDSNASMEGISYDIRDAAGHTYASFTVDKNGKVTGQSSVSVNSSTLLDDKMTAVSVVEYQGEYYYHFKWNRSLIDAGCFYLVENDTSGTLGGYSYKKNAAVTKIGEWSSGVYMKLSAATNSNLKDDTFGAYGKIEVYKTDKAGKPLGGAEFTIRNSAGKVAGVITTGIGTGSNGIHYNLGYAALGNLEEGTYTVEETRPPLGYERDTTIYTVHVLTKEQSYTYDGLYYGYVYNSHYYLAHNSDVNERWAAYPEKAFDHYLKHGIYEGRQGIENFDIKEYRELYPDLEKAFGSDKTAYLKHFINKNTAEQRMGRNKAYFEALPKGVSCDGSPVVVIHAENVLKKAYVKLKKVSEDNSVQLEKGWYSLKGTQYGLYRYKNDALQNKNPIHTFTTDASGDTSAFDVARYMEVAPNGSFINTVFYLRELKAGKNFELDGTVKTVEVSNSNTADNPAIITLSDKPVRYYVGIMKSDNFGKPVSAVFDIYGKKKGSDDKPEGGTLLIKGAMPDSQRGILTAEVTKYLGEYESFYAVETATDAQHVILKNAKNLRLYSESDPPVPIPWTNPVKVYMNVIKKSRRPALSKGNINYNFEGTQYGLYSKWEDADKGENPLHVFSFDKDGNTEPFDVSDYMIRRDNAGMLLDTPFYMKELKAGKNFLLDYRVYRLTVTQWNSADNPAVIELEDSPMTDPVRIVIEKTDADGAPVPQGDATLAGAQFRLNYYAVDMEKDYTAAELKALIPTAGWTIETKEEDGRYRAFLAEDYLTGDDNSELYYEENGSIPTLPMGYLTIEEVKAPEGYKLDGAVFETSLGRISEDGILVAKTYVENELSFGLMVGNQRISSDNECLLNSQDKVIRGDFSLSKTDENENPMAGVRFSIASLATGEKHYFETDSQGHYDSSENRGSDRLWFSLNSDGSTIAGKPEDYASYGALPYGNYVIKEERCEANRGRQLEKAITLVINDESVKIAADNITNVPKPELKTFAYIGTEGQDFGKLLPADSKVTINDRVDYKWLRADTGYVLEGSLMIVRPDGTVEEYKQDGNPIKTLKLFRTPKDYSRSIYECCGTETVSFDIDTTGLEGCRLVVYEKLYLSDVETQSSELEPQLSNVEPQLSNVEPHLSDVEPQSGDVESQSGDVESQSGDVESQSSEDSNRPATEDDQYYGYEPGDEMDIFPVLHEDISSLQQTVYIPNIRTEAFLTATGINLGQAESDSSITDRVYYDGLEPGEAYSLNSSLVLSDEETKELTHQITSFVPDSSSGYIDIEMKLDATELNSKSVVAFEHLYKGEILLVDHSDINDAAQTVHFSGGHTKAEDKVTKTAVGAAEKEASIVDHIYYKNLVPGRSYKAYGTLMIRETGLPFTDQAGEPYHSETEFVPETADGVVDVIFTFDATLLKGNRVVVFEDVKQNDITVFTHADLEDEGQTVHYLQLETQAYMDGVDDFKNSERYEIGHENVKLVDNVSYSGLDKDVTYRVEGILIDKNTGEAFIGDAGEIIGRTAFAPEKEAGTVEVEFNFTAELKKDTDLVIYERLYLVTDEGEICVGSHEDLNAESQTIRLTGRSKPEKPSTPAKPGTPTVPSTPSTPASPSNPHTSDAVTGIVFLINAASIAGASSLYKRRKKKKK